MCKRGRFFIFIFLFTDFSFDGGHQSSAVCVWRWYVKHYSWRDWLWPLFKSSSLDKMKLLQSMLVENLSLLLVSLELWSWELWSISRPKNRVSFKLDKISLGVNEERIWLDEIPLYLRNLIWRISLSHMVQLK